MGKHTSSTKLIMEKTLELFERIVDKELLARRLTITANHLLAEAEVQASGEAIQMTLFDDPEETARREAEEDRERRMQKALLAIKGKFGPNAILKGTSFQEGATARERNESIGGHKA